MLIEHYKNALSQGKLEQDSAQEGALTHLEQLYKTLQENTKEGEEKGQLFTWHYTSERPKGVYFYGTVGRGKSMLMDLFFQHVSHVKKRRVHFHAFMKELHQRMHVLPSGLGVDPMHKIASDIAKEAQLLCFDEFYITNIADAMMLGRFFEKLVQTGVVVCATSNWAPEDLFLDGHNRSRFKPFIGMIEKTFDVVSLGDGVDWRTAGGQGLPRFIVERGDFMHQLDETFHELSANKPPLPVEEVTLAGQTFPVERVGERIAWFHFKDVCESHVGRNHYLAMVEQFDTVMVDSVPCLSPDEADAALRFVVLVDILYENKCKLVLSAHVPLDEVCTQGDAAFAFERTISRIHEMQRF